MKPLQMKDWSYLPKDIVRLIMEKLCWSERVRLCVIICKNWQLTIHEIEQIRTGIDMFPWFVYFNWNQYGDRPVCSLLDPAMEKCYIVDIENTIVKKLGAKRKYSSLPAYPYASSYGWVLFRNNEIDFVCNSKPSYFLYSPFTNEAIDLPLFELESNQTVTGQSFSLSSSSPDCFVFVLVGEYFTGRQIIRMCKPGDQTWRVKLELDGKFSEPRGVAYANESFYCLYDDGKLFAFNIKLQEWKLLVNQTERWAPTPPCYLILSSTGDILLKTAASRFYRLDLFEKQWIEVNDETMKQHVIFLGQTSLSVPALGKASKFAGTINHCFDHQPMVPDCYKGHAALLKRENNMMDRTAIWVEPGIWRACDLIHSCFMDGLKYASSHEWVKHEGLVATIGITHLAQDHLGEVVSVHLPEPGGSLIQGRGFGAVENIKGFRHVIRSPISGEVVQVNFKLLEEPYLINSNPYKEGWMIKVKLKNPSELESLMAWNEYTKLFIGTNSKCSKYGRQHCKDKPQVPDEIKENNKLRKEKKAELAAKPEKACYCL